MTSFRTFVVAALAGLFCLLEAFNARAQVPEAWYEPATGGITFRNVNVVGLRLTSAGGLLISGQKTHLGGAADCVFSLCTDRAPLSLEWGNLVGITFESAFAGNVLPENLTHQELLQDITFDYRTAAQPSVEQFGSLFSVPEPSALALAVLAWLVLISWHGRKLRTIRV